MAQEAPVYGLYSDSSFAEDTIKHASHCDNVQESCPLSVFEDTENMPFACKSLIGTRMMVSRFPAVIILPRPRILLSGRLRRRDGLYPHPG